MDQEYFDNPDVAAVYEAFGQADGPLDAPSTDASALPDDGAAQTDPVAGDLTQLAEAQDAEAGEIEAEGEQPSDPSEELARLQQELEAREQALAEREREAEAQRQAEFEKQQRSARLLATLQNIKDEQASQQILAELQETNPDLANTFIQARVRTQQQVQQATQRVQGLEKGTAAFAYAVQALLPEEQWNEVLNLSHELIAFDNPQAMQHFLQTRLQAHHAATAELEQLRRQVQELQLRQQAQGRDPRADQVEATTGRPAPTAIRPEQATNMDDYWDSLIASTPWLQAS